ncbi:tRNA pseudouridine synthase A [Pontibacter pamirensis]|uniref:tRNA pseudouridine synthase A n=1 Tax=Pontibacter pamirensis TaxID=2562824 RepID=UPI00138A1106|nr:tRNA pseudouridine synthase A [Pontibacter pamirensis]
MQTIRLRVNEKVYEHLMWFLSKFNKDELQIIEEGEEFASIQKDLQQELTRVEEGSAEFIDLQQLDTDLESTIQKYEA